MSFNPLFQSPQIPLQALKVLATLSLHRKNTLSVIPIINYGCKLENGQSIQFKGFVVRLEQRINLIDGQTEYGISVQ